MDDVIKVKVYLMIVNHMWMDGWMECFIDGWTNESVGLWMDSWMDIFVDGWMDGIFH